MGRRTPTGQVFLNGAVPMVNVALNESRNNLEQNSTNEIHYDVNKRITINELVAAVRRVDSSKGDHPYGLHLRFPKFFKFFCAQLFSQRFNTSIDTGFWPFNKVSVGLSKKREKVNEMLFS